MKIKIIPFVIIAAVIMLFVFVQKNNKKSQPIFTSAAPAIITPIPTEAANVMDSPDGNMTLTLEEKKALQSLFVSSKTDGKKIPIYKKEKVGSRKLEIPYNTWSPDNIYVFLKEKTPTIDNYLVFQSSGKLFSNNLPYVSIQELFNKSIPNYFIEDVTGWAAPNLLIINTRANESNNKVSFWFDVPNQSFTQLGTYFN